MSVAATNPIRGISFKILSVMLFLMMQTCIKSAGADIPAGQITFYRSAFALVPILLYLAWLKDLPGAFYTRNPFGHFKRGVLGILSMACGFYGLVHLPMPDAIALGYASPLMAVIFAALVLREKIRVYRWTAVFFGMVGVIVILFPKLTLLREGGFGSSEGMGAISVLMAAILAGLAMIQVRQLVASEKTATIVVYFSLTGAALSLFSLPFGWVSLGLTDTLLLIACGVFGGVAQLFLTESYRHAEVSTIAPFEYSSIIIGIAISYVMFGDVPTLTMLVGTAIVVSAGIFIIYREHQLGLSRRAAKKASTPQG